jgi:hypothetical protein
MAIVVQTDCSLLCKTCKDPAKDVTWSASVSH